MLSYTLNLKINGSSENILERCRIDNDSKIYTKDKTSTLTVGDKLVCVRGDGHEDTYQIVEYWNKINALGSKEIRVKLLDAN
ncbi:hypothetical protein [Acinetobacter bereziniae]|uniref:hypothetical protein n=1 Tax=Acinetobacter bereziniae TaxID=106648 RepID=UPI001250B35D|nr:hypothetical protein [Acinetobacter bereziniae]